MKLIVWLFSLYVLFLSGVPCSPDDECCNDEIAQTIVNNNQKGEDKHKPESPCSPFFACNACHGVVIPPVTIECYYKITNIIKLEFEYRSHPLNDISPSIWQPPKLA